MESEGDHNTQSMTDSIQPVKNDNNQNVDRESHQRKRRRKTAFDIDPYITRHSTDKQGTVTLMCCNFTLKENKTRIRKHFLSCQPFKRKFSAAFVELSDNSSSPTKQAVTPEYQAKLDDAFANAVIKDGLPFNTCQSKNWNAFWKLVFGTAYRIPSREKISDSHLPLLHNSVVRECSDKLKEAHSICLSVDGFSNVLSKSVFHLLASFPIPLHINSFRVGSEKGSSIDLNARLKALINECSSLYGFKVTNVYGLVTDSPNVMVKTRRLCTGELQGGHKFVAFAYGCACHAISSVVKDMVKIKELNNLFREVVSMASFFKNTHHANHLLSIERQKLKPIPKNINTFSPTHWNCISAMFRSILDCRQAIGCVFTNEMTNPGAKDASLENSDSKSKASAIYQLSLKRDYWSNLSTFTPILEVVTLVLTFLKSDLCPVSMVPLSFTFLRDFIQRHLEPVQAKVVVESLVTRYQVICSDVHVLAVVLDPLVPKERYRDLTYFLKGRPVLTVAQGALERDLLFGGKSSKEIEECVRSLVVHTSGQGVYTMYADAYHPILWWSTIGAERSPVLAEVAVRVFSLSPSSAGAEQSYKARCLAYDKTRVRLADKQSSIIFNSEQLRRIDEAVLASKRCGQLEALLVRGYSNYINNNGDSILELLSSIRQSEPCSSFRDSTVNELEFEDDDFSFAIEEEHEI